MDTEVKHTALNNNKEVLPMYEFKNVRGHIEVYLHGVFQFSADDIGEAKREIGGEHGQGTAD